MAPSLHVVGEEGDANAGRVTGRSSRGGGAAAGVHAGFSCRLLRHVVLRSRGRNAQSTLAQIVLLCAKSTLNAGTGGMATFKQAQVKSMAAAFFDSLPGATSAQSPMPALSNAELQLCGFPEPDRFLVVSKPHQRAARGKSNQPTPSERGSGAGNCVSRDLRCIAEPLRSVRRCGAAGLNSAGGGC